MSSWLNFNDSLNNIKGQITNFATSVLADNEENGASASFEDLKQICLKQELEIKQLQSVVQENKYKNNDNDEIPQPNSSTDNWNWKETNEIESNGNNEVTHISDLKKRITILETENSELITQLEQLDEDNQKNISKIMTIKDNLQDENNEIKDKLERLQLANKKLSANEKKLKSSTSADEKCSVLLKDNEKLKEDNEKLKNEISDLKNVSPFEDLGGGPIKDEAFAQLQSDYETMKCQLQEAKQTITQYENSSKEDSNNCAKLSTILETYEKQVTLLKEEIEVLNQSKLALAQEKDELNERYNQLNSDKSQETIKLKDDYMKLVSESNNIHSKYVSILTESVKKFLDGEPQAQADDSKHEGEIQIREFSKQVENLMKILSDFKIKCETFEKEIYELSQEKTKILTEKNFEIERLIQNSEMLSQELISKSQVIKEYENECVELEKNNELLIKELDNFKNSSSLQTISESNEDNMLLMESQLENANKRIDDLEKIVDEFEKQQEVGNVQDSHNVNIALQQSEKHIEDLEKIIVDMEKEKESQPSAVAHKDYQNLLQKYDELILEKDSLNVDRKRNHEIIKELTEENNDLKASFDKMKMELDNSEYQTTETNVNLETLKEEYEHCKKQNFNLLENNKTLELMHIESKNNNENIVAELNSIREKLLLEEDCRKQANAEIKIITEKLQHSKVSETSLKLQCDTMNKELGVTSEAKRNLEEALKTANSDIQRYENNYLEMQKQNDSLKHEVEGLENKIMELENNISDLNGLLEQSSLKLIQYENPIVEEVNVKEIDSTNKDELTPQLTEESVINGSKLEVEMKDMKNNLEEAQTNNKNLQEKIFTLEKELETINFARRELINLIQTKDQESVTYYNEIQRLTQILQIESSKSLTLEAQLKDFTSNDNEKQQKLNEANEKLSDQNEFLRQKCELLAENLLKEQSKVQSILAERPSVSEKELALQKELDRLKSHLIEVEETLTQELLEAEQKNSDLISKLKNIEEREKNSSTMYTSISIRVNQQVEVLQKQVQSLTSQRDDLRKKISEAEDQSNKQSAALTNLQFVLEQFQKDKDKDIMKETERIRRQINAEKVVQEELSNEIRNLRQQLDDSKQGLQAAARLSEQLELAKKNNVSLKEEVTQLSNSLKLSEEKIKNLCCQTDGKIEKSLIKNLVIGYVSCNKNMNKDQTQILKIIATVLDFNQQDHDKVNSSKNQQGSWLGSLLTPAPGQNMSEESLSKAFVKFLENESKPRIMPSLLNTQSSNGTATTASNVKAAPSQSPIVLSEIVLPTFADFAQNRNSSSILKDVLKDATTSN